MGVALHRCGGECGVSGWLSKVTTCNYSRGVYTGMYIDRCTRG